MGCLNTSRPSFTPRADVAADLFDRNRVALRSVAAAFRRSVQHGPSPTELLAQGALVAGELLLYGGAQGYNQDLSHRICAPRGPRIGDMETTIFTTRLVPAFDRSLKAREQRARDVVERGAAPTIHGAP